MEARMEAAQGDTNPFTTFLANIGTAWKVLIPVLTALGMIWLRLDSIDRRMDKLESQQITAFNDRFTLTMKAEDALRMAILNPGLRVPDPRRPGEFIKVEPGGAP